jgi:hypothetical protein
MREDHMDLFGAPTPAKEEQSDLFPPGAGPALEAAEAVARATVSRLSRKVAAYTASPSELESYREALALLRRHLKYSHEEMAVRCRLM